MKLSSRLFRLARTVNNVETVSSGNPRRMGRRAVNAGVSRGLGRVGFWRWLWR